MERTFDERKNEVEKSMDRVMESMDHEYFENLHIVEFRIQMICKFTDQDGGIHKIKQDARIREIETDVKHRDGSFNVKEITNIF